jgi:hypothetical protein
MSSDFSVTGEINRYMSEIELQLTRIASIADNVASIRAELSNKAEVGRDHVEALETSASEARSLAASVSSLRGSLDSLATAVSRFSVTVTERTQVLSDSADSVTGRIQGLHGSLDDVIDQVRRGVGEISTTAKEAIGTAENSAQSSLSSLRRVTDEVELSLSRTVRDATDNLNRVVAELPSAVLALFTPPMNLIDGARIRLEEMIDGGLAPEVDGVIERARALNSELDNMGARLDEAFARGVESGRAALDPVVSTFQTRIAEINSSITSIETLLSRSTDFERLSSSVVNANAATGELLAIQAEIREALLSRRPSIQDRMQIAVFSAAAVFLMSRYILEVTGEKSLFAAIPAFLVSLWGEPPVSAWMRSKQNGGRGS